MQLRCRQCETALHPADVDFDELMAQCRTCGWVFGSHASPYRRPGGVREEAAANPSPEARSALVMPMPEGIEVTEDGGRFAVAVRPGLPAWLLGSTIALLVVWFTQAVSQPSVLTWLAGAIGTAAFGYVTAARTINTVTLEVIGTAFRVRQGPIPWPASVVRATDLNQLYVNELPVSRLKPMATYDVCAILRNGRHRVLVSSLSTPQQALYMEERLEAHLGLMNRHVVGELRRGLSD